MYIASMDIETVFDVARPQHISKTLGEQDAHGWITAAPLRGNGGFGRARNFRVLIAGSISRGASAKEVSKRRLAGSNWLSTFSGTWRRNGKGSIWGSAWTKVTVVAIRYAVFLWADNHSIVPRSKKVGTGDVGIDWGGRKMGSGSHDSMLVVVKYICG